MLIKKLHDFENIFGVSGEARNASVFDFEVGFDGLVELSFADFCPQSFGAR